MSSKDYTIILINENRITRADLGRKGQLAENDLIEQSVPPESTLLEAVESVTTKGKSVGRKAIVLTTRIWSQIVSLPALAIDGLSEEELRNALKFEIETLSGVDAELALIGFQKIREASGNFQFWVSVIPAFEFSQVVSLLETRGCRAVFLGHPAGMGVLGTEPQIEFWPGLVCHRKADDLGEVEFSHASPDSGRWIEDFELGKEAIGNAGYLLSESNAIESLAGFGVELDRVKNLDSGSELIDWLSSVVGKLENKSACPPFIVKRKPESTPKTRIVLKALLAILAIAACYAHWSWINQQDKKIAAEIERYRKPTQEKKSYDSEIFKTIKKRNDLEQEAENIRLDSRKVQFLLESQTDRIASLLQILRDLHTSDIMINEISQDDKGLYIAGISLNSETAPMLANRMRDLARPKGWQVTPAAQMGKKEMINGGPWDFKIRLTDSGPVQAGTTAQSIDTLPVNKKRP